MDRQTDYLALKIAVLIHLRSLFYESPLGREPMPLELTLVAADLGVSVLLVQGTIRELLTLGLARPTRSVGDSAPHLAVAQGECEITPEGLNYLLQLDTAERMRYVAPSWGTAGLDLP